MTEQIRLEGGGSFQRLEVWWLKWHRMNFSEGLMVALGLVDKELEMAAEEMTDMKNRQLGKPFVNQFWIIL